MDEEQNSADARIEVEENSKTKKFYIESLLVRSRSAAMQQDEPPTSHRSSLPLSSPPDPRPARPSQSNGNYVLVTIGIPLDWIIEWMAQKTFFIESPFFKNSQSHVKNKKFYFLNFLSFVNHVNGH